jgi:uncharacterized protein (DUF952 family)
MVNFIYHITTRLAWETALKQGSYHPESLSREGFIHFSEREQVLETAQLYFKEHSNLVLLTIDALKLSSPLKYEMSRNGEMFPHLYGPLEVAAVVKVQNFRRNSLGSFELPKE